jgi:transcriptional regulator with XRE-family HTH domain
MDDEKLKRQIGRNIATFRKRMGWTQVELAEKLNYSDKAVSKWERGESVPDVLTLADLADAVGVTVNDLLADLNALPAETGAVQQTMDRVVQKTLKRKANKNIILGLCTILVWFVALFIYVLLSSLEVNKSWLAFFYAIPANAIVLLSLRSAWHDFRWNRALISAIMWGGLLGIYMTLLVLAHFNLWKIFLLGILGQVAILLWFKMFRPVKESKEEETDHG